MRGKEAFAATMLAVSLAAGCGGGNGNEPSPEIGPMAFGINTEQQAKEICDVEQLGLDEYINNVSPDLLSDLGHVAHGGDREFFPNLARNTRDVAEALAPNNFGLATVATILSSESGISHGEIASEGAQLATRMQKSEKKRDEVCLDVVSRVLDTPRIADYQSSTGKIAEFVTTYNGKKIVNGMAANSTANNATVKVFQLGPIANSENAALDQAISVNWGITAEGEVIKTSQEEGQVKVDKNGNPVKVSKEAPNTIAPNEEDKQARGEDSSNNRNQNSRNNGGGGSGTNSGTGGGSGGESGGGCGGSCGTGSNGGGGCGSCGGGKKPTTPTTGATPTTVVTRPPNPTTTTSTRPPVIVTTTTTLSTTTTTKPKGPDPGCKPPNPFC